MEKEEFEDTEEEEKHRLIRNAVNMLREHFDTVQIFCSRHVDDDIGTLVHKHGSGNWYARYGQVKDWILDQENSKAQNETP